LGNGTATWNSSQDKPVRGKSRTEWNFTEKGKKKLGRAKKKKKKTRKDLRVAKKKGHLVAKRPIQGSDKKGRRKITMWVKPMKRT